MKLASTLLVAPSMTFAVTQAQAAGPGPIAPSRLAPALPLSSETVDEIASLMATPPFDKAVWGLGQRAQGRTELVAGGRELNMVTGSGTCTAVARRSSRRARGARGFMAIFIAVLAAGCVTGAALARVPGEGPLDEAEIKSVIRSALPGATFRYRRVDYTGPGAVLAGKAVSKRGRTFFRIVSGRPIYEHRRYIPRKVIAPRGTIMDDLRTRVAQGRRPSGPKINLDMSVSLLVALCDYRAGEPCGI